MHCTLYINPEGFINPELAHIKVCPEVTKSHPGLFKPELLYILGFYIFPELSTSVISMFIKYPDFTKTYLSRAENKLEKQSNTWQEIMTINEFVPIARMIMALYVCVCA